MLDALFPAARAAAAEQSPQRQLALAADAAQAGAKATAGTRARRGRASYLGERTVGHVDPGAQAVAIWLHALASAAG